MFSRFKHAAESDQKLGLALAYEKRDGALRDYLVAARGEINRLHGQVKSVEREISSSRTERGPANELESEKMEDHIVTLLYKRWAIEKELEALKQRSRT